ncbi:MAG: DegT/DnrJ/EryC1/StrS family aminotransferase [Myxococcales bacterium]|nr:DegT/DnrJ/EryC1/StrS family aminotransferase [Myxococcales bacterium]
MSEAARVALFDLARVLAPHRPALHAALERCLDHGTFVLGPEVQAFERALQAYTGHNHAIGLASGTDSLLATLMALVQQGRIGAGDDVLVPSFTFIASATSIMRAGLRPVFVDLAPDAFTPDVVAFDAAWTPRTRAVLSVHLFGAPQPLADVAVLCHARGAVLVEDCAQAIGARQTDGRHVGHTGVVGALSFFPAKNLGALGDGGAALTDDAELAAVIRAKRQHGFTVRYQADHLGGNFRLDALQAAFLQVLLPALDGWLAARTAHAQAYSAAFAPLVRAGRVQLPAVVPGHAWNQYVVRTPLRDRLQQALTGAGIGSAIYYPSGLHTQPVFSACGPQGPQPCTAQMCTEVLALPVYPGLTATERDRVAEVTTAALAA